MQTFRLREVADIYSGATPLTKKKEFYDKGSISWITPKDLSGFVHKYIYVGKRCITQEGYDSCATTLLPEGAVLFSSRAPIGYVAIAGKPLCTNQGFKSFVCNEKYLYNQYLYYYLIKNRNRIEALGNGSTFKEVSRKTISEYQITLPSIEEQKKIVSDLVDLDRRFDENHSNIEDIEELLECLYCKYYEDESKEYENYELGDVVEIVTGGTPSTKNESYWTNGVYYWYTPTDVTSKKCMISYGANCKISVSGLTNSSAKLIPVHSVLLTSRATIGEATINMSEATTNQGMVALVPKNEKTNALQLYFWVKRNKKMISSIANGSTFKEVYKKDLEKLNIKINTKINELFDRDTQKLFELYESLVRENQTINELKYAMIDLKF